MTERIRLHLDENVAPDVAQLAYALEEGRVIVTHDADFSRTDMLGVLNTQVLRIATSQPVQWEKSSER